MSKSMECCTRRVFLGGGLSLASGLVPVFGAKKPSLPPYYESYLEDVARRINSHAGEATDGFWFLADIHVPVNAAQSGKIIAALAGKVPIDNVFCGGDLGSTVHGISKARILDWFAISFSKQNLRFLHYGELQRYGSSATLYLIRKKKKLWMCKEKLHITCLACCFSTSGLLSHLYTFSKIC